VTNDAEHQRVTLECAGNVLVPFKIEPRAVFNTVSFGQIERTSESKRKTVTITRGDGGPLAPELLPIDDPHIKASLREIEPGEHYELDIEIGPPWPKSQAVHANLKLKTGVSEAPEESIRVYGRIAPRLRASPPRFSIPRNLKSERDLRVSLVWSGGKPGNIIDVTTSDPQTSVRVEENNNRQMVVLRVPADYEPPTRGGAYVTVTTDDPEARTLSIRVYAPPTSRRTVRQPISLRRPTIRPAKRPAQPPAEPPKKQEPEQ
jgi:hypothetical protein